MKTLTIVFTSLVLFLFSGCSWLCKPSVRVVYVTTKCPKLSTVHSGYVLSTIDDNVTLRILDGK